MNNRIEDLIEFMDALDYGIVNFYNQGGAAMGLNRTFSIGYIEDLIENGLFTEKPDPEPARYLYHDLHWDWFCGLYPVIEVLDNRGEMECRPSLVGTGHYQDNREYRLCGFTDTESDDEPGYQFSYSRATGKKRYARFVLQKESE